MFQYQPFHLQILYWLFTTKFWNLEFHFFALFPCFLQTIYLLPSPPFIYLLKINYYLPRVIFKHNYRMIQYKVTAIRIYNKNDIWNSWFKLACALRHEFEKKIQISQSRVNPCLLELSLLILLWPRKFHIISALTVKNWESFGNPLFLSFCAQSVILHNFFISWG